MVNLVTPGGEPADPDWLSEGIQDSAPDPDGVNIPADSISVTDPSGGTPSRDWLSDTRDSPQLTPTSSPSRTLDVTVIPNGGPDIGVIAVVVGIIAVAWALLGGD
jgi:hypothetical protein